MYYFGPLCTNLLFNRPKWSSSGSLLFHDFFFLFLLSKWTWEDTASFISTYHWRPVTLHNIDSSTHSFLSMNQPRARNTHWQKASWGEHTKCFNCLVGLCKLIVIWKMFSWSPFNQMFSCLPLMFSALRLLQNDRTWSASWSWTRSTPETHLAGDDPEA